MTTDYKKIVKDAVDAAGAIPDTEPITRQIVISRLVDHALMRDDHEAMMALQRSTAVGASIAGQESR